MSRSLTPVATLARSTLYSRIAPRTLHGFPNSFATPLRDITRPAAAVGTAYHKTDLFRRYFHHTPQAMSDPSKSKSESEWRAILSPEQVRTAAHLHFNVRTDDITRPDAVQDPPAEGHGARGYGQV